MKKEIVEKLVLKMHELMYYWDVISSYEREINLSDCYPSKMSYDELESGLFDIFEDFYTVGTAKDINDIILTNPKEVGFISLVTEICELLKNIQEQDQGKEFWNRHFNGLDDMFIDGNDLDNVVSKFVAWENSLKKINTNKSSNENYKQERTSVNHMKYGDIVKHKGKLGKVVTDDKSNFLFHPLGFGSYYYNELDIITEQDIEVASYEEHVEFIEKDFAWGMIIKTHSISEYQIIEYKLEKEDDIKYHGYINFKDTNTSNDTLDGALMSTMIQNKLEVNEARWAYAFIQRILNNKCQ